MIDSRNENFCEVKNSSFSGYQITISDLKAGNFIWDLFFVENNFFLFKN